MPRLDVPMYDPRLVQPMREELTRIGFQELRTADEVDAALAAGRDTALVVVNSVCGCAARNARPAATLALQHARRPDRLLTVFAGRSEEHTSELQSLAYLVCRLLLEKKKKKKYQKRKVDNVR